MTKLVRIKDILLKGGYTHIKSTTGGKADIANSIFSNMNNYQRDKLMIVYKSYDEHEYAVKVVDNKILVLYKSLSIEVYTNCYLSEEIYNSFVVLDSDFNKILNSSYTDAYSLNNKSNLLFLKSNTEIGIYYTSLNEYITIDDLVTFDDKTYYKKGKMWYNIDTVYDTIITYTGKKINKSEIINCINNELEV